VFLKCVKVYMSWNKRNNCNNMHGATIKIQHLISLDFNSNENLDYGVLGYDAVLPHEL